MNRAFVHKMSSPSKPLLPSWLPFVHSGRVPPDVSSEHETSDISESVFLVRRHCLIVVLTFGLRASRSTDLDPYAQNLDHDKMLGRAPSRIHYVRLFLRSLYYHRIRKMEGYHFGILSGAVVATMVLIINLSFTIWAVLSFKTQSGLGTLYDGSCKRTRTLTFWVHLAINVFSTLLLGASNYSMQCLSSPTRGEIDKAHGQSIWLDIGVPSVRNLRRLSPIRVALWWLLAISSIPLHLLYNSAVFSSLCTHQYNLFMVSNDFLSGAPFNMKLLVDINTGAATSDDHLPETLLDRLETTVQNYQKNPKALAVLENNACIEVYTAPIISSESDLLVVLNYTDASNSLIALLHNVDSQLMHATPEYALCLFPGTCNTSTNPQNWSTDGFARAATLAAEGYGLFNREYVFVRDYVEFLNGTYIQYCLSQHVEEHCKLQFSLVVMVIVMICNLIKTICMGWIAWKQDPEPLVTLGDAIVSFLDRPDITTKGLCMKGKSRFERSRSWVSLPSKWDHKPIRWFRTASERRWLVCNIL